jgi:hypothetical protein
VPEAVSALMVASSARATVAGSLSASSAAGSPRGGWRAGGGKRPSARCAVFSAGAAGGGVPAAESGGGVTVVPGASAETMGDFRPNVLDTASTAAGATNGAVTDNVAPVLIFALFSSSKIRTFSPDFSRLSSIFALAASRFLGRCSLL